MIAYDSKDPLKIFRRKGSVFPFAMKVGLPCAALSGSLEWMQNRGLLVIERFPGDQENTPSLINATIWSGFVSMVAFLVIFRTSISYGRFWAGATCIKRMGSSWYNSCSLLFSFTSASRATEDDIWRFKHLLVRLFSAMHALGLSEVEDKDSDELHHIKAFNMDLIDVGGLDEDSLVEIRESQQRVLLINQWIQLVILDGMNQGVVEIPAPIATRIFNELATGLSQYVEATDVSDVPFPFPFAQTCDLLLLLHWVFTPFVSSFWLQSVLSVSIFSFIQVFSLWAVNAIAVELENPFGDDDNDVGTAALQQAMNRNLLQLLMPGTHRVPMLSGQASLVTPTRALSGEEVKDGLTAASRSALLNGGSLYSVWKTARRAGVMGKEDCGSFRRASLNSKASGFRCDTFAENDASHRKSQVLTRMSAFGPDLPSSRFRSSPMSVVPNREDEHIEASCETCGKASASSTSPELTRAVATAAHGCQLDLSELLMAERVSLKTVFDSIGVDHPFWQQFRESEAAARASVTRSSV